MFRKEEIKGLTFFTVPFFRDINIVTHGFTTRVGGNSQTPYQSLNMGYTVGDNSIMVLENRKLVAKALEFPIENLVAAKQIHQDKIAIVTQKDAGKGALTYVDALDDTDALITAEKNIPLSTYYADCVPIFILDPIAPAIGLAHAGWKGTVLKIGAKTIAKMTEAFGTKAKNCWVAIGPSIGPCCYQVDETVWRNFQNNFLNGGSFFQNSIPGHWQLNLWEANKFCLIEEGVPKNQIISSNICTACNTNLFFSHRKEKGLTGRMAAFMMLKN